MQKTIALFAALNGGENNYKKHYQLGGWKGKAHVAYKSPCPAEV